MGYNHYIDYCGNDITFKGEYKRNKLFIRRGRENASNNKINIGDILFISNSLKVNLYGNNATVKIGNSCSFCEVLIQTTTDGIVEIGNSCMFSIPIGLFQVDGHHIFDLNTKERINKNKNIYIGNHVWVGMLASLAAAPYLIIVLLAQIPLPVINLQKKTALLQVIPVRL